MSRGLEQLQQLPAHLLPVDPADMEAALTSDVHGSGTEEAEGDDGEVPEEMRPEVDEDPVDGLLSGGAKSSPIINPNPEEEEEDVGNHDVVPA